MVSRVGMVSELRRLKASIPCVQANSNKLSNIGHFGAFAAGVIHFKKPSVGPKGLIGPPCHGAPWPPEAASGDAYLILHPLLFAGVRWIWARPRLAASNDSG